MKALTLTIAGSFDKQLNCAKIRYFDQINTEVDNT